MSRTAAAAIAGETVVAAQHLDIPVLMRIGMLALSARSDAATRAQAGAPSCEQLLVAEAATWALPEAVTIAGLLSNHSPHEGRALEARPPNAVMMGGPVRTANR
ncbi:hypothetical protein [Nocardia otitidiscaviarum]|uniref:hypothetical protein n=1 Tax=Nocardia otitidiscaviarum TaxID=1823 RepID=UPI0024552CBD|nr:hypothetical protein [Nocardia otitidiscaviarum]